LGKRFSTGIAIAIAITVTDTTVVAAGDVRLTIDYV
jgi:hypothetical protein